MNMYIKPLSVIVEVNSMDYDSEWKNFILN